MRMVRPKTSTTCVVCRKPIAAGDLVGLVNVTPSQIGRGHPACIANLVKARRASRATVEEKKT